MHSFSCSVSELRSVEHILDILYFQPEHSLHSVRLRRRAFQRLRTFRCTFHDAHTQTNKQTHTHTHLHILSLSISYPLTYVETVHLNSKHDTFHINASNCPTFFTFNVSLKHYRFISRFFPIDADNSCIPNHLYRTITHDFSSCQTSRPLCATSPC